MQNLQPVLGIIVIVVIALLHGKLGSQQKLNSQVVKLILAGLGLQFILGVSLLHSDILQQGLSWINEAVLAVSRATAEGTSFVFGYLGGGETPYEITKPHHSFILAFQALPLVIVFSALFALFWHWGITAAVVKGFAILLRKLFNISGAAGLGSASSIFIGMVESPLLIKPYLQRISYAELFIVMTCGMATVAGTVMALYAFFLADVIDNALSHILIASVISAPAAIMLALLMKPETADHQIEFAAQGLGQRYESSMHAIIRGTEEGLKLFLNIVATLLVFVSLVSLINQCLGLLPDFNQNPMTLQRIFSWLFAPLVWLLGIPWSEAATAAELMGVKVVINELFAYVQLSQLPAGLLSDRSELIMTYALCGFANFGSLGILIAGFCSLCPQRSSEFIRLAPLSIWSGLLATSLTGAVVGLIT